MNKIVCLIVTLAWTFLIGCHEKNPIDEKLQSLVDLTFEENPNAIGIILHVEAPEKNISWGGAVGYSNRETKDLLHPDQPGRIASCTKTFVAATILRLIEMGKIEIDQPIRELLHERTETLLTSNGYATDSITIGQLLSHKSGMPSTATPKYLDKENNDLFYRWTRDEKIEDAIIMMERGEPGQSFFYSDLNYLLLSEIIEQATHTSFYLAMSDLINYDKIGLKHTWFHTLEAEPKETQPRFYQYIESRDWANSYDESMTWGLYGPMGLVSTAEDMANFMIALFGGEIFEKSETLELMLSDIKTKDGNIIEHKYYDKYPSNYYMGIEHTKIDEIEMYGHTGYWGSLMAYIPESNIAIGLFVLNGESADGFEMELINETVKIIKNN